MDPDGVAEAVMRLSRPEVQVLMALTGAAEKSHGGLGDRFGGPGFAELVRRGAGRIGSVEVLVCCRWPAASSWWIHGWRASALCGR